MLLHHNDNFTHRDVTYKADEGKYQGLLETEKRMAEEATAACRSAMRPPWQLFKSCEDDVRTLTTMSKSSDHHTAALEQTVSKLKHHLHETEEALASAEEKRRQLADRHAQEIVEAKDEAHAKYRESLELAQAENKEKMADAEHRFRHLIEAERKANDERLHNITVQHKKVLHAKQEASEQQLASTSSALEANVAFLKKRVEELEASSEAKDARLKAVVEGYDDTISAHKQETEQRHRSLLEAERKASEERVAKLERRQHAALEDLKREMAETQAPQS